MRPEDRLLFACTRQNFSSHHADTVHALCAATSIDWRLVYTTAQQHGVAPLIHTNLTHPFLAGLAMPAAVKAKFEQACYHNIVLKAKLAHDLQKVLAFFQRYGIGVMLVKGTALDLVVYDQPWYTVQDVDIVLNLREEQVSAEKRTELFAIFGDLTGFEYDFYEHHDVIMNGILPVDFQQIWANAKPVTFHEQPVWIMCPEDLLLAACINSCRKRFFRLKSLLDIAEIITKFPALNWGQLVENVQRYDCRAIVYAALFITQQTVGCSLPVSLLAHLQLQPWRAALIQQLARRLSLSAFAKHPPGLPLFNRPLNWPLLLPYVTLEGYQVWRRIRYVSQTPAGR